MTTLGNRVAGLGTSEPVIQKQGADRIVVELPGIQDTAKARDLIGRTATLEIHMVDESAEAHAATDGTGPVPFGDAALPVPRRRRSSSSRATSSSAATTCPTRSRARTSRTPAPSST